MYNEPNLFGKLCFDILIILTKDALRPFASWPTEFTFVIIQDISLHEKILISWSCGGR
jgi:hypothetical protein